jgi:ferritin-like metal-binding protein YciE
MDQGLYNLLIRETHLLLGAEHEQSRRSRELIGKMRREHMRAVFERHASDTEEQIRRLERILTAAGEQWNGEIPAAIRGLLEDMRSIADADWKGETRDVAIASAARKIQHYGIGCYKNVVMIAEELGLENVASTLITCLKEEERTDHQLEQELRQVLFDLTPQESRPTGFAELL